MKLLETDISKILFSIQKKYKSLKPEVTIIIASDLDEVITCSSNCSRTDYSKSNR